MADHVHKQLRAAAATALTGLATTGANCFPSRVYPIPNGTTAALKVYVQSGDAELIEATEPEEYAETVELRVEAVVEAATAYDDLVDQIKKEVQAALSGGLTVAGKTVSVTYRGFDTSDEGEAAKPQSSCVMRFESVLYYAADTPDTLEQA